MSFPVWLAFFAACWAISLSPGAGAVAAMNAGLQHGFRRGYWVTIGLVGGIMTQLAVVAVGLGALIASNPVAFAAVKWAGVAYLVWIGIRQWLARPAPLAEGAVAKDRDTSAAHLVAKGWIINALNPKGTVFLLAVVPQFLDLKQPLLPQYLIIGASLVFTDLVVMAGYTLLAARLLRRLSSPRQQLAMNRTFGSLFILAGAWLALFRRT